MHFIIIIIIIPRSMLSSTFLNVLSLLFGHQSSHHINPFFFSVFPAIFVQDYYLHCAYSFNQFLQKINKMKNDSICFFFFSISIGNLFAKIVFCSFLCCLYRPAACKSINPKLFIFVRTSERCWWVRGGITEAIVLKYITNNCSSGILILLK